MNRPKRRTFVKKYGWEHTERYIQALETYSHYLEKALDKACNHLVNLKKAADCYEYEQCPFREECERTKSGNCYNANSWKELSMKDE